MVRQKGKPMVMLRVKELQKEKQKDWLKVMQKVNLKERRKDWLKVKGLLKGKLTES